MEVELRREVVDRLCELPPEEWDEVAATRAERAAAVENGLAVEFALWRMSCRQTLEDGTNPE